MFPRHNNVTESKDHYISYNLICYLSDGKVELTIHTKEEALLVIDSLKRLVKAFDKAKQTIAKQSKKRRVK